jgi:hypothetical protein
VETVANSAGTLYLDGGSWVCRSGSSYSTLKSYPCRTMGLPLVPRKYFAMGPKKFWSEWEKYSPLRNLGLGLAVGQVLIYIPVDGKLPVGC